MSKSNNTELATLHVDAPLGVDITVLDASMSVIETAKEQLSLQLEAGAYKIEFKAAKKQQSQLLILKPGEHKSLSAPDRVKPVGITPELSAARRVRVSRKRSSTSRDALTKTVLSKHLGGDGEVFIFVKAYDVRATSDVGRSIKIFRFAKKDPIVDFQDLKSAASELPGRAFGPGWSAGRFSLEPDQYVLEFETSLGTASRTLPVYSGRTTAIYLEYVRLAKSEWALSPNIMTLTSQPETGEAFEPDSDALKVSELILQGVFRGKPAFSTDTFRALLELDVTRSGLESLGANASWAKDPMLWIYLATHFAQLQSISERKSAKQSAQLNEPWISFGSQCIAHLDSLSMDLGNSPPLSDVMILRRFFSRRTGAPLTRDSLTRPPLLSHCFSMALEESVSDPSFIPDGGLASEAGETRLLTQPWMSWRGRLTGNREGSPEPTDGQIGLTQNMLKAILEDAELQSTYASEARVSRQRRDTSTLIEWLRTHYMLSDDDEIVEMRSGAEYDRDSVLKNIAWAMGAPMPRVIDALSKSAIESVMLKHIKGLIGENHSSKRWRSDSLLKDESTVRKIAEGLSNSGVFRIADDTVDNFIQSRTYTDFESFRDGLAALTFSKE